MFKAANWTEGSRFSGVRESVPSPRIVFRQDMEKHGNVTQVE